jgi:transposase
MQINTAAPLGGRQLDFLSSEKTSRARLPLFTRDDSPIEGWRLA